MSDDPYTTSDVDSPTDTTRHRSTVSGLHLVQATALTMLFAGATIAVLFRFTPYFVFHNVWFEWVAEQLSNGDFSAEPQWSYAMVYTIGMAAPHILLTGMIFAGVLWWISRAPTQRPSSERQTSLRE